MALFPESDVKEENALRKYDCLLLLLLNIEMYTSSSPLQNASGLAARMIYP